MSVVGYGVRGICATILMLRDDGNSAWKDPGNLIPMYPGKKIYQ